MVDDGSSPPLEEILEDAKRHCPLKVINKTEIDIKGFEINNNITK